MRILIDLQGCQSESRFRGIGRYSLALTEAIIRNRGQHTVMLLLNGLHVNGFNELRARFSSVISEDNIFTFDADGPVAEVDTSNSMRARLAELSRERLIVAIAPDVVLLTSLFEGFVDDSITSLGLLGQGPFTVVTLYDLIPFLNPDPNWPKHYADYYARKIESLKKADLLLSISEYSMAECAQAIPELADRILNMSSAASLFIDNSLVNSKRLELVRQKFGIERPFVMSVGNLEARKNYEGLIRAFALLPEDVKSGLDLLLVGGGDGPGVERLQKMALKEGLEPNQLRLLSHISDDDLVAIYSICELFVFPSLHEGFGLPPLEAMACGAAVIGSNTTSLPEVIGRADAMFDPTSPQEISVLMAKVLTEPAFKKSLQEHARYQSGLFSWDRTAKVALAAFEKKIKERRPFVKATYKNESLFSKPRLAMLVPLPPEQTGIAVYVAELLPALSALYEITVISDQGVVTPGPNVDCVSVRSVAWFEQHAKDFERIVYQIGNSPFHAHMFDLLKRHPGVVVLHDFYLSNVFHWMESTGYQPNAFRNALLRSNGYRAFEVLEKFGETEAVARFSCNYEVICNALAVIVNSQFSRDLVALHYGEKFCHKVKVAKLQRAVPQNVNRAVARQELGLADNDFVVCAFGFMHYTKMNVELLDAWAQSKLGLDKSCKLVFVGGKDGGEYGALIDARDLGVQITITDFVDGNTFSNYLAAADVSVQLRTNSRGETSGTILDCLSHGLPLIINSHGPVNEYPDDLFLKINDDFVLTELVDALNRMKSDISFRKRLGAAGINYVRDFHSTERTASTYYDLIEKVVTNTKMHQLKLSIERFWGNFSHVDLAVRDQVANAVGNGMYLPRKHKLYLDISATAKYDLKTGIERVARAYLHELLKSPPLGYDVEPVYLSKENEQWRVRKAQKYLSEQPGFHLVSPIDELVLPESGDMLLALDLSPDAVVQAFQHGLYTYWRASGARTGFMVYDILPISHPQFFPDWAEESHIGWVKAVCNSADMLVCISATVKDELSKWIETHLQAPLPYPKLEFCHLGADLRASFPSLGLPAEAEATLRRLSVSPTFLMVGTIEPRKGYLQTLSAFDQLWQRGVNVNLVIVGSEGWKPVEPSQRRTIPEIVNHIRSSHEFGRQLFWLEGVSDEYLEKIYSVATCLIAASEGEGFGLPLIEAAQHGLPIIARDIPIFREVAGKHTFYFNGIEPQALVDAVKCWITLSAKDKVPQSDTMPWLTWKESARELINVIMQD